MALRVATITPYYKESIDYLRQCHESVAAQTYPSTHFMVADGFPLTELAAWNVEHIALSRSHDDGGGTPRMVGALSAMSLGYDALAFLDADNWFHPKHVETMVAVHTQTGRNICIASRKIHRIDGSFMYNAQDDGHIDTSCYFLVGEATRLMPLWGVMPKPLSKISDRIFWKCITVRNIPFVHVTTPTVSYRTAYKAHYEAAGERPPEGAKDSAGAEAYEWFDTASKEEKNSWERFFFGKEESWQNLRP